jgi:hypothetical protein
MSEVGRVTPGKPIWPEPHRDLPERQRDEQEDSTPERRKKKQEQRDAPPDAPAGGHIDEYV